MDVAVVGAGAVGTTTAHDLAERGTDVTLFERDEIGSGSTGRAAGLCYGAFSRPTDAELGARAMARFRAVAADSRFAFVDTPYVQIAREGDDESAAAVRELAGAMRANGADVETLDADALADRFPALVADDVAAATLVHDAARADTEAYAEVMAERAAAAGATVRTGTPVRVDPSPGVVVDGRTTTYDAVVVTAGAHTGPLLAEAGVDLPVAAYRVQALVTAPVADGVPMGFDATRDIYWRPHGDGLLVGDGTEERRFDPDDWDPEADDAFVASTLDRLDAALVGASSDVDRAWAGLCTATPDRDPLLGEVDPGLFVATGLQGHGFMRSPALGEKLADAVLGGDGVDAFDPRRFDGDVSFEVRSGMPGE